jgi:hypothetical protein
MGQTACLSQGGVINNSRDDAIVLSTTVLRVHYQIRSSLIHTIYKMKGVVPPLVLAYYY